MKIKSNAWILGAVMVGMVGSASGCANRDSCA